jgi:hypothetical protein
MPSITDCEQEIKREERDTAKSTTQQWPPHPMQYGLGRMVSRITIAHESGSILHKRPQVR